MILGEFSNGLEKKGGAGRSGGLVVCSFDDFLPTAAPRGTLLW